MPTAAAYEKGSSANGQHRPPMIKNETRSSFPERGNGKQMAYFRWRRNSIRLNPLKPTKARVVGSGTGVIIISPLGGPLGLATPETSARTIIAEESRMDPPPPKPPLPPTPPPTPLALLLPTPPAPPCKKL